jgi:transcriptional regulator with XRE-family HTH domain
MDQEKIGKFIAACRKECNLTQEQVAEKLGVSNKTVSRWENGNGFPDVSLLQPLCELLNISVNELLLGEKIPENNYRKKVEENTIRILEGCRFSLESGQYFENSEKTINLSFFGIVAIIFIILKLTGTITWSWLWVLSPLWIGLILCAIIIAVALIIMKIIIKNKNWQKCIWKMPKIKIKFF